uniref:Uncharacterized protein n=1 Tax=Cacopsylla melanoneura TaxID=428564 RepID=A0A8D8TDI8_9HEMI
MTLFSFTCPALINQNFTWKKIKLKSAFSTSLKPFTWRKMYFCKAILLFLFGLIMMLGTSMAIAAPDPYPQYGGYYGGRGGGGGRGGYGYRGYGGRGGGYNMRGGGGRGYRGGGGYYRG